MILDIPKRIATLVGVGLAIAWAGAAWTANAASLDAVTFAKMPGDRVQIKLELSEPVAEPLSFAIDSPARVALDFPDVTLNLPRKTQTIGVGMARSVAAVEASGRTRVVLNLIKLVPYQLRVEGSAVYVTLDSPGAAGTAAFRTEMETAGGDQRRLENVDFRRGPASEGRIIVTMSDPSTVVDTREEGSRVVVDFLNTSLPDRLERRLDVIDFATPAQTVDTFAQGDDTRMVINTQGLYELLAYQSDELFTIEVKPLTKQEEEALKKERYTGERLSLNFQNIEVRAVLQLIADFTGKNLVASDTVSGNLTLRLKNVPWDQALDIILRAKGLAKREQGNVIMVAPSEEIAAREKLELEAQKQITELAPLTTEFVQVNYAKASEIAKLLKAEENSLLSERGNVSVDERTNTLLVRDTADNLVGVRKLVTQLDIPVRQVLIESRIVVADDNFNRDLGVRFGISRTERNNETYTFGGGNPGDTEFGDGTVAFFTDNRENLIVDLPLADPSGAVKFAIIDIPDFLLQLELQALQTEGRGEVLANPRVVTSNQKEAIIEQGTEIPFQEASSSGATSTSFKPAVLSLRVTPQITPDDRIIMDLAVNQDTVGQEFNGIPSVDTRALTTQVLVDNGDTVVLGGIFEQTKRSDIEKVPFFGDLPYFGFLFKQESLRDEKTELLIFVTPKIVKDTLSF